MSESQNSYYEKYFQNGGTYELGKVGDVSRLTLIQEMLEAVLKTGAKILDVGCGDMEFAKRMPQFEWTGVDLTTEKAQGNAIALDAMKPPYPFAKHSFDAVISSEFLEHIWDMRVVHKEARRLLKPNGVYVISTPNFDWIENYLTHFQLITFDPARPWTMEHIRHYTPGIHIHQLASQGFNVYDVCGTDPHYGTFFQVARSELKQELWGRLKIPKYEVDGQIDALLSRMFPQHCAGVIVAARSA